MYLIFLNAWERNSTLFTNCFKQINHKAVLLYCIYLITLKKTNMWPWTTKPVISSRGIFVVNAKNTLYVLKLSHFLLCQKSLGYYVIIYFRWYRNQVILKFWSDTTFNIYMKKTCILHPCFKSEQLSFASAVVIVNYLSLGLENFPSECNASETQKVSHSGVRLPSQQISPPILRVHGSVALQSVLSETLNTTAFTEEKPI